jgi:hypothetical protein
MAGWKSTKISFEVVLYSVVAGKGGKRTETLSAHVIHGEISPCAWESRVSGNRKWPRGKTNLPRNRHDENQRVSGRDRSDNNRPSSAGSDGRCGGREAGSTPPPSSGDHQHNHQHNHHQVHRLRQHRRRRGCGRDTQQVIAPTAKADAAEPHTHRAGGGAAVLLRGVGRRLGRCCLMRSAALGTDCRPRSGRRLG